MFVDGKIPLGFVSSPLISNIYLDIFDDIFSGHFSNLIYTRYSDDILISSESMFDYSDVINFITSEFSKISLKLNYKKRSFKTLKNNGDHIRFLGLNIVKKDSSNFLTVGKKYIKQVSKEIEYFNSHSNSLSEYNVVKGKVEYINFISKSDYMYLNKVYKIKTNLEMNINIQYF